MQFSRYFNTKGCELVVLISNVIHPLTALICILMLTCSASAAPEAAGVRAEIVAMPLGSNVELRLKNKERLRGARGTVSESGFTLLGPRSGERQVAFVDVASAKQFRVKSHAGRNMLIGVAIGVGVAAIVIISLAKPAAPRIFGSL
jgi:hypothetical protein